MRKTRLLSAVLAGDARWVGAVARAPDLLDVGRAARLGAVGQLIAVLPAAAAAPRGAAGGMAGNAGDAAGGALRF